ncbi:MAG: helix-hairpin-helix domain-containing protein [FCB group bacterium]|nr:helix-hairpin-helix domain-containing protein [FCB group bacterium]
MEFRTGLVRLNLVFTDWMICIKMSLLSKWGFSRQERTAIILLLLALLTGMAISYFRHRQIAHGMTTLTAEDSSMIRQIGELSASVISGDKKSDFRTDSINYNTFLSLNINAASAAELQKLPGIGPVISARIVDYRRIHGPFASPDSLLRVNGIGPSKLKKIINHIFVETSITEE